MKFNKLILIIILFLKTGNVLSDNNIFNVNNIEIEKRGKINNNMLANQAIKEGFNQLLEKILLKDDLEKLSDLKFTEIKELVLYYNISNKINKNNNIKKIVFNVLFDKNKIHDLFFKKNISYSEITNRELYLLPILKKDDQIFIYNKNFFYSEWNKFYKSELIEFILPLENIEIIQIANLNKKNLFNLKLSTLFKEYSSKNLALVLIEDNNLDEETVYFKTKILGKNITKNIKIKKYNLKKNEFYKKIITNVKIEIENLVKSQNLIDIRTPSFLNAQLKITKNSNLIELNLRLKKIGLIENIFIQEFNKNTVYLTIKYLGKLDKIIKQLEEQKVMLKNKNDYWIIKII
jgi:hypothetical protein